MIRVSMRVSHFSHCGDGGLRNAFFRHVLTKQSCPPASHFYRFLHVKPYYPRDRFLRVITVVINTEHVEVTQKERGATQTPVDS